MYICMFNTFSEVCTISDRPQTISATTMSAKNHIGHMKRPEMCGYRLLISASYPYQLETIRIRILSVQTLLTAIRILSVSMVLLRYNYTASQKNSPDIFDCSFKHYYYYYYIGVRF